VNNEIGGLATFITPKGFLMELELLSMNRRIRPFNPADCLNNLVLVIKNN
jgi:hypothetical protein